MHHHWNLWISLILLYLMCAAVKKLKAAGGSEVVNNSFDMDTLLEQLPDGPLWKIVQAFDRSATGQARLVNRKLLHAVNANVSKLVIIPDDFDRDTGPQMLASLKHLIEAVGPTAKAVHLFADWTSTAGDEYADESIAAAIETLGRICSVVETLMVREMVDGWTRAPIALGAAFIRLAPHLRELRLEQLDMDAGLMASLAQLVNLRKLRCLYVWIPDDYDGRRRLAAALSVIPHLEELDLHLQSIRTGDPLKHVPQALAEALPHMTSLKVLSVRSMSITATELTPALVTALLRVEKIEFVNLRLETGPSLGGPCCWEVIGWPALPLSRF